MKKILILTMVLTTLFFISCSNNDDEPIQNKKQWTAQPVLKLLSSTWIYDKPSEQSWEKTEFRESGIFYTSYYDNSIYQISEELNGKYSLDKNGNITGQYKLSSGTLMNLDWSITAISNLSLSVKNNTAGLEFTYGKLLLEVNIKSGETMKPNYEELIPDTITTYKNINNGEMAQPHIVGFSSHNSKIVEVDSKTGEIKAMSGGRTYIDVITTEGTAVVEVNVAGILPYDYCEFLGKTREEIYEQFGKSPYSDTDKQIMYLLSDGDFGYLVFNFDTWTNSVKAVSVVAKESPSFTNAEMKEYLNSAYYVYEKGTTEKQYAYINADTYDKATAGIIWYPDSRQLVVVTINHDLFTDYSPLLGKTKDEILSLMDGTPYKNTDAYITYGLDDKYLGMVAFYYTWDFTNYSQTSLLIIASVKDTERQDEIIKYLNNKYLFMENASSDTNRIYLTSDGKLAIEYNLEYNQIWYYKNEAPTSAKITKFKMSKMK